MLILIIVLVLLFGGGLGYWGNGQYPGWGGPSFGLGGVLLVLLILYLLGYLRR